MLAAVVAGPSCRRAHGIPTSRRAVVSSGAVDGRPGTFAACVVGRPTRTARARHPPTRDRGRDRQRCYPRHVERPVHVAVPRLRVLGI